MDFLPRHLVIFHGIDERETRKKNKLRGQVSCPLLARKTHRNVRQLMLLLVLLLVLVLLFLALPQSLYHNRILVLVLRSPLFKSRQWILYLTLPGIVSFLLNQSLKNRERRTRRRRDLLTVLWRLIHQWNGVITRPVCLFLARCEAVLPLHSYADHQRLDTLVVIVVDSRVGFVPTAVKRLDSALAILLFAEPRRLSFTSMTGLRQERLIQLVLLVLSLVMKWIMRVANTFAVSWQRTSAWLCSN
mmetsp:Transcript_25659/g.36540  ORF Transcript_25659/g.36540 Transcript_25659/m.36540 type:complete len:245 (+) Transcript_25659:1034-1768(+)